MCSPHISTVAVAFVTEGVAETGVGVVEGPSEAGACEGAELLCGGAELLCGGGILAGVLTAVEGELLGFGTDARASAVDEGGAGTTRGELTAVDGGAPARVRVPCAGGGATEVTGATWTGERTGVARPVPGFEALSNRWLA
ncbi:hypothetical protein ACFQ9X_20585 [Catenulispora yoronensis]